MAGEVIDHDVVIVGAGFAGLYMLHKLRQQGFDALVIEAGDGIGGTWHWNRYPGARCDIPSMEYCYSFDRELQSEWRWTERYATGPEILAYIEHVADRFALRDGIRLSTRVTSAHWNEASDTWAVTTDKGDTLTARWVVMATGCLSKPHLPDWPGIENFAGEIHHTGDWPQGGIDVSGKRVGVVGTGSSGIQVISTIAADAGELVVFQRTPSFFVPANNRPLGDAEVAAMQAEYDHLRDKARSSFLGFFELPEANAGSALDDDEAARAAQYEKCWNAGTTGLLQAYGDLLVNEKANATAAEFARAKIAALVHDPEKARLLTPTGYPIGARRLCSEIGYFDTMNRANVTLVDVRGAAIERVGGKTVVLADGRRFELDVLILATGYDAITGALTAIDIRGEQGKSLNDDWSDGPRAYLGLMVAGFPNLFTITGPGSPSVLSNVILSIEQHVQWIAGCLGALRERGATRIAPTPETEAQWVDHVHEVAQVTLFPRATGTWYHTTARDGRRVFMPYVGGVGPYRDYCAAVADEGYRGFAIGVPVAA
ncbi:MAG: NAD(P)/FAD-dependent oxidoreductase [Sphingomonadales bacterium]|nr:NAD(P)/FAD-dependent oxidoreductase [Sphingomonadales bacterium]MDE2570214.1 NAD(P)/FAD-dependent oxidoreductase [Sphingomonadales bacterium]